MQCARSPIKTLSKNIVDTPIRGWDDWYSPFLMPRPHSNSRVDKAGDYISNRLNWPVPQDAWDEFLDAEIDIINAWRALHAVPLDAVSRQLAVRAQGIDPSTIFSQRLKRLRAIRHKLMHEPSMQLTTMQDIAGCRAVVKTIEQTYALKKKYESYAVRLPGIGSELVPAWTRDYIRDPKPDGYRSVHLVLRFRTTKPHQVHCNGLRVEIQIRSNAQHAWATAVETASAVTSQALKSGEGEEDWKQSPQHPLGAFTFSAVLRGRSLLALPPPWL